MSKFTHLHVHTEYSLLDGLGKINELLEKAKNSGMDSLAITDHGTMYGVIDFYSQAKKAGIKPIIGCEMYLAKRSHKDKEARVDVEPAHLTVLAKNSTGYQSLIKLVTIAHLEGFYYKPRVDLELLQQCHEGLIALSGCPDGQINRLLLNNQDEEAEKLAYQYQEIFSKDNFYLEVQRHKIERLDNLEPLVKKVVDLSQKTKIPLVATNDVHYVDADDAEAQEVLLCVQTKKTLDDPNRKLTMIDSPDFYLRTPEEMEVLFHDLPEALTNTQKIAKMCNVEIELGGWLLPHFPLPNNQSAEDYLRQFCQEKIYEKYDKVTTEMLDRMNRELDIIIKRGYAPYFLIVADFVNWAKDQGIAVGPGRGSSAGAIVSYLLNITSVDPIFFRLPFERFLNPKRPKAPDIDLDFADNRRDEVIEYVRQKYGRDHVAQIITFGRMEARGAVRDVGRVLGMPYSGPDRIAKMIPFGQSIVRALKAVPELREAYDTEAQTKRLLDLAQKLEGVSRHASVHACGVVIADDPVVEYVPLQYESKSQAVITQYDMYSAEKVGLLKMDFLGLRNLTIIEVALSFIKENQNLDLDITEVPLNDQKTFTMLGRGETTGIFQLESAGMRKHITNLKPTSIFDLMAMVALYRPGPMQIIPEFIERKNNPDQVSFLHPKLKEICKESYGLITFQDDVLLTAVEIAGFDWGEADKLRHAMSSKGDRPEMKAIRDKFISGLVKSGKMKKADAEKMYRLIEPFGAYGFNKAHAACYSMIAYRTAYLKANFPVEFMTAVLTAEAHNTDKIASIVAECKRLGIEVLTPDINCSQNGFAIENLSAIGDLQRVQVRSQESGVRNQGIRFGLSAIKNVGTTAIESILTARQEEPFKSLDDFCQRVDSRLVNKKVLESLIKSGAFDKFGKRSVLLAQMDQCMSRAAKFKKHRQNGQMGFFDNRMVGCDFGGNKNGENIISLEEASTKEMLAWEKSLLGFYFSDHPLKKYSEKLSEIVSHKIVDLNDEDADVRVRLAGVVSSVRRIFTRKNNDEMAFVKLEDETGGVEAIVFPKVFNESKYLWYVDRIIVLDGRLDTKDSFGGRQEVKVIVEKAREIG